MRVELERTEKIERFLLGLFSKEEEHHFKQQLINDSNLDLELKWQKLLMKRIEKIAIKQEISMVHSKYMQRFRFSFENKVFRNWIIGLSSVLIIALGGVFIVNLIDNQSDTFEEAESLFNPIVNSELPFNETRVNTNETVLLNYNTGTFIIIPSNAFMDENDVVVTDEVDIRFKEFNSEEKKPPISLKNDSLALEPTLMIEFYVLKHGKPLKIRPGKEVEIVQLTKTISSLFSVYQYNTDNEQWSEKGEHWCIDLSGQVIDNQLLPSLLVSLHIENPRQDPEILREQEAYLEILQQLHVMDSVNNTIRQKHLHKKVKLPTKSGVLYEVLDLYRQRMVLLANTKDLDLKDTLIKIEPKREALTNSSDYLFKGIAILQSPVLLIE